MYIQSVLNVDMSSICNSIYSEVCPVCGEKMTVSENEQYHMCEMCFSENEDS